MDRVKSKIKHQYETIKQMLFLTLMLVNSMFENGLTSNWNWASRSDKEARSNFIETAFYCFPKINLLQINNQLSVH